jgi:hypothetical protein
MGSPGSQCLLICDTWRFIAFQRPIWRASYFAALKLREGASLPPQEPDSHEDQRRDRGLLPSLSPGFRNAARRLHPEGARRRSEDLPPNRRLCRWSPRRDFHRHAQGGRDLPLADDQFRDRRVAWSTARRPARGIRRRIHRHPLRACRPGRGKRKDQTRDIGPRLHLSRATFSLAHSGQFARRSPSAGRFRGLSVGSIRNPNRRSSIDSKYALDARAVSRLSFQLWTSKPRIRTS